MNQREYELYGTVIISERMGALSAAAAEDGVQVKPPNSPGMVRLNSLS